MTINSRTRWFHPLLRVSAVVGVLLVWSALTPEVIPELVFPSPASVLSAAMSVGPDLFVHAAYTLLRVVSGWIIGSGIGVAFGLLMTWNRGVFALSNPVIEALRPLPPVALIPFFIIWFGLGAAGQVALIALGCFMVLVINTVIAVQNLPPVYIRAASSLGASKLDAYLTVVLPGILPSLVSGFRVAAALAFGLGVAAEFMGAQSGLGFLIMVARRTLNTNTILLGTILIGLESYLIDRFIRRAAAYYCRWSETSIEAISQLGSRISLGGKQT